MNDHATMKALADGMTPIAAALFRDFVRTVDPQERKGTRAVVATVLLAVCVKTLQQAGIKAETLHKLIDSAEKAAGAPTPAVNVTPGTEGGIA